MAHVGSLIHYGRLYILGMVFRFFAHDFDYESLSLRIGEGGVLPRRTKNPFIEKAKKKTRKGKTQAHDMGENEAAPAPFPKSEAQEREKELRSNPVAEVDAPTQRRVERPEQAAEPSVVGTLKGGVTVEVGPTRSSTHKTLTHVPEGYRSSAGGARARNPRDRPSPSRGGRFRRGV
jgi:hypothetical protein